MHKVHSTDSVVLQVQGDALQKAEQVAAAMGAKLQVMKSFPIRPRKEDKRLWYKVFRRRLPRQAGFVAILHTQRGQCIQVLKYGRSHGVQLEFHGLQALDAKSYMLSDAAIQQQATLEEFLAAWTGPVRIMRLDRSIDLVGQQWKGFTNSRMHRSLCKKCGASTFKNTTLYYQPKKPTYTKVLAYDKKNKDGLDYEVTRIEFRFLPQYWKNMSGEGMSLIEMATAKADEFVKKRFSVK